MAPKHLITGSLTLALSALLLSGCGGGGTAADYKTPEEAFTAFKTAAQKDDYKTLSDCLTDDSREMLAGQAAFGAVMFKTFAELGGKAAEAKELTTILEKHGLTEAALKKMDKGAVGGGDPEGIKKAMKELVAPVKDRSAFFADVMGAMKKYSKEKGAAIPLGDAELKDLKTEGSSAKGIMVTKQGGQEKRDPIEFKKVGNSWRIELPMSALK